MSKDLELIRLLDIINIRCVSMYPVLILVLVLVVFIIIIIIFVVIFFTVILVFFILIIRHQGTTPEPNIAGRYP